MIASVFDERKQLICWARDWTHSFDTLEMEERDALVRV